MEEEEVSKPKRKADVDSTTKWKKYFKQMHPLMKHKFF
jgi:hypothetical protein